MQGREQQGSLSAGRDQSATPPALTGQAFGFIKAFLAIVVVASAMVWLAIALIDPFGVSPIRLPIARPIMDINQRYMYPQIVRSKAHDSVVIGTSTSRLLDPERPQRGLRRTFRQFGDERRHRLGADRARQALPPPTNRRPRPSSWGSTRCGASRRANCRRITFRGFPEWMYDENPWNDLPHLFSLQTLEIAGRLLLYQFGLMPERIRRDGYEIFTPPEATYDLARARWHIWRDVPEGRVTPATPPVVLSAEQIATLRFPALAWLDELLARVPSGAFRMLVAMPVHVAAQPRPGSHAAAVIGECMQRISAVARRHGVTYVDFAIPSPVTAEDSNYWDPLHYRLPIARRIIDGMQAARDGRNSPDGLYRLH